MWHEYMKGPLFEVKTCKSGGPVDHELNAHFVLPKGAGEHTRAQAPITHELNSSPFQEGRERATPSFEITPLLVVARTHRWAAHVHTGGV